MPPDTPDTNALKGLPSSIPMATPMPLPLRGSARKATTSTISSALRSAPILPSSMEAHVEKVNEYIEDILKVEVGIEAIDNPSNVMDEAAPVTIPMEPTYTDIKLSS